MSLLNTGLSPAPLCPPSVRWPPGLPWQGPGEFCPDWDLGKDGRQREIAVWSSWQPLPRSPPPPPPSSQSFLAFFIFFTFTILILWVKIQPLGGCGTYTNRYYSVIKENEVMPFAATWMQLAIITDWSDTEKVKYRSSYMWHLQCYTNELVYKTDSQTQKADLLLPRGKGGGGTNREIGMSRCKLFYTGWMDNELLLYCSLLGYSVCWDKLQWKRVCLICRFNWTTKACLVTQIVNSLIAMQEIWVWSRGQEDSLEEGLATLSCIFAWRIPRTEKPGGLQSMGSHRVRHDWATNAHNWITAVQQKLM